MTKVMKTFGLVETLYRECTSIQIIFNLRCQSRWPAQFEGRRAKVFEAVGSSVFLFRSTHMFSLPLAFSLQIEVLFRVQ